MWEFSLNFKSENFELAKFVYNALLTPIHTMAGIITSYEENGYISLLFAVEEENKECLQSLISGAVTEIVCTKFKADYLNDALALPMQDKMGLFAFKKALLNFDRETDKYLVKRAISFNNLMYVESFFAFKLKALQDKWAELVTLSNENRDYLVCKESFIDLLKFLVDNLDICENEISVVKEEGGYRILAEGDIYYKGLISEEKIVSSVIDLSPQKINLYFKESDSAISMLERIFEERVIINNLNYKNVEKFELSKQNC